MTTMNGTDQPEVEVVEQPGETTQQFEGSDTSAPDPEGEREAPPAEEPAAAVGDDPIDTVSLRERIAVCESFSPAERDFLLGLMTPG